MDAVIGDPQNPFHPIRLIGMGISAGLAAYRKVGIKFPALQFIAGAVLSLLIIILSYTLARLFTQGLYRLNYWAGLAAEAIICYFLIAAKALIVRIAICPICRNTTILFYPN